ncbi:head-tail connector protein [Evtepia sp.]|uniref:head-tail connector protein n=1 Tax=Evtepia sp. TaxID=2773933 RepID=UPI003F158A86
MYIDLEAVKSYCRIDGNDEDELIQAFVDTAKGYLEGAGVPEPEADDPRYLLCVKAMVLEFYDHRGMTESVTPSAIPGLANMVVQLKLEAEAERIVRSET